MSLGDRQAVEAGALSPRDEFLGRSFGPVRPGHQEVATVAFGSDLDPPGIAVEGAVLHQAAFDFAFEVGLNGLAAVGAAGGEELVPGDVAIPAAG